MAREGQFDSQQLLSRARLQTDGSLGKVLIAEPDLRRQAAAPKPAHAETGGALLTAGVDEKEMDPVLERIVRPKFERYVDADRRHPAPDPAPQQSRLGGRPATAVEPSDPMHGSQPGAHPRH